MISNFLISLRILSRHVGQKLLPIAKKYLAVLMKWIQLNKDIVSEKLVRFFKVFLKVIERLALFIRDIIPRIRGMVRELGGLEKTLKIIGISLAVVFGLQLANMIGTAVMGIGALVASMLGLLPAATAMNIAMGFLPVIIGLAVIAIALLTQDVYGFLNGQESLLQDVIDRWTEWRGIISDITKAIMLFTPPGWLLQGISFLTTGKTVVDHIQKADETRAKLKDLQQKGEQGAMDDFLREMEREKELADLLTLDSHAIRQVHDELKAEGLPGFSPYVLSGEFRREASGGSPTLNQNNTFNIDGGDIEAVRDTVTDTLSTGYKQLYNNASSKAVGLKGG